MFYDFRKAFLLYVLFKVFLNQNINIINLPGVPLLTMELFMNVCFFVYFIFFQRKTFYSEEKFPLKMAFIYCLASIFISTVFSSVGFSSAITRALRDLFNIYIFIYILWCVLREKEDIVFLVMGFSYIFIILGLYGFYEKYTGVNPLMDYQVLLNPSYKVIEWVYSDYGRLGMGRIRSAILHPIGFGVYLSIIITFYLFIQNKYERIWKQSNYLKFLLFFLCICCLFFTNSRGPLLYLFISVLAVFSFKNIRTYQIVYIGLIGILFAWNFIEPYFANIISFYDSSVATKIGGSTIDMRIYQFSTAFDFFSPSPFIGLGIKSMDSFLGRSGIHGGESIWIWLLIERGILGCVSHIILIISIARIGKGEMKYFIWGSTLAWIILTTATSTPGVEISFFLTIILILNRIQKLPEKKIL
jgi:hypothetical protein